MGERASARVSNPATWDLLRAESAQEWPWLSVIVPCRNEARFIAACLDSIVGNGYPADRMEVLVVDGMSSDGTREVVCSYAGRYPFIRMLDNPRRITPCALNIGIAAARGDVVIRMDAHATYEPGYIGYCVDALERYGADNAGGVWRVTAPDGGLISKATLAVMAHRFGGAARYRSHRPTDGAEPLMAELVPFFCCRRETLRKIGPFNERLVRHQDFEYVVRLRRAGARFMLVPRAVCNYYARTGFRSFCLHNFRDGMWTILAAAYSEVLPFSLRHLVPLIALVVLVGGCVAAPFSVLVRYVLGALLLAYAAAALFSAAQIAARERRPDLSFAVPPIFVARHVAFGLGSLVGLAGAVAAAVRGFLMSGRRATQADEERCGRAGVRKE